MIANSVAVLLAGGRSERVGMPKGLILVNGVTWLEHQVRTLRRAGIEKIVLVTGYFHSAYLESVNSSHLNIDIVYNEKHEVGPFSSVQTGVSFCFQNYFNNSGILTSSISSAGISKAGISNAGISNAGVFICPIDIPVAHREVFQKLEEQLVSGVMAVVPIWKPLLSKQFFGSTVIARRGHPLLLSVEACLQVLALDGSHKSARLDLFLRGLSDLQKREVSVSDVRVLMNMNTVQDWKSLAPLMVDAPEACLVPQNRERTSVVCVRDGKVLLVKARDPFSGCEYFFPPGGGLETDEDPSAAGIREVWEECGYEVEVDTPECGYLDYLFSWNGVLYFLRTHLFVGTVVNESVEYVKPDADDLIGRRWVPVSDLKNVLGFHVALCDMVTQLAQHHNFEM